MLFHPARVPGQLDGGGAKPKKIRVANCCLDKYGTVMLAEAVALELAQPMGSPLLRQVISRFDSGGVRTSRDCEIYGVMDSGWK